MTFFDCVQRIKGEVEKRGYRFEFIDNVYTGRQFVEINGHRVQVIYEGAGWSDIKQVWKALARACNKGMRKAQQWKTQQQ